jgi:hypothetical protein
MVMAQFTSEPRGGSLSRISRPGTCGWLHVVSHNVARLFLPVTLLALPISSPNSGLLGRGVRTGASRFQL